jgi:hypothetical protein
MWNDDRPIRERLGEMLSKLDELEALAHELVETEQKILTMDSSTDDLAVARLKAQVERKRHQCEQLRGALDKLQDPRPFGIGPEKYRDTLAFTKHIQKKEVRAEASVVVGNVLFQSLKGV